MEIIAKTDNGFLVEAKASELKEIIRSVSGEAPDNIKIGHKIPAIDYASTITKIKALSDNYSYTNLMDAINRFSKEAKSLEDSVTAARCIDE